MAIAEYFEALQEQKLSRCPYHKPRPDTVARCDLNESVCDIELGNYDCDEWKDIQAEWLQEEHEIKPKPWPSYKIVVDKSCI